MTCYTEDTPLDIKTTDIKLQIVVYRKIILEGEGAHSMDNYFYEDNVLPDIRGVHF